MLDPALGYIVVLSLVVLLGAAALHKLQAPNDFVQVLAAYRLLPGYVAPVAAQGLPLVELATGFALLLPGSRRVACIAAAGLLTIYGCAMAVNIGRGRRDIDCGCRLVSDRRPIATWMVIRNACLATAALSILLPWASRPLAAVDALTIAAGALSAALLYVSIDALCSLSVRSPNMMRNQ